MEKVRNDAAGFVVTGLIEVINANRAYLSEIDGAIGDGDHGINMSKGFSAAGDRLRPPPAGPSPSASPGWQLPPSREGTRPATSSRGWAVRAAWANDRGVSWTRAPPHVRYSCNPPPARSRRRSSRPERQGRTRRSLLQK